MGTIATWDIESKESCWKASFVFFVKKLFNFLDWIGVGQYTFGSSGFEGKFNRCIICQKAGPERNALAREKIINSLGGREKCAKIRTIDFCDAPQACLKIAIIRFFHSKESVVQGEDQLGRKFVVLFLTDKRGNSFSATAHQRYRETCVQDQGYDGRHWILNINDRDYASHGYASYNISLDEGSTDKVAKFIEDVMNGEHKQFSIAKRR